jgi:hypothetical protein
MWFEIATAHVYEAINKMKMNQRSFLGDFGA